MTFDILNEYGIKHSFYAKPNDYSERKYDNENVYYLKQNHTNKVVIIEENDKIDDSKFLDCDGVITNLKGKTLVIRTADCQSIFLYDPKKNVIGNIHSGWRGTLDTILLNAINLMVDTYDSHKEDIICCFNPSILGCHFEIGNDVYSMFKDKFNYIDEFLCDKKIVDKENKYYLDLLKFNIDLLKKNGIKKIYYSDVCTYCNNDCHSYRRDKTKLRNGSFITL